jgi:hypothetical protein
MNCDDRIGGIVLAGKQHPDLGMLGFLFQFLNFF